jgi:hypothetical protein
MNSGIVGGVYLGMRATLLREGVSCGVNFGVYGNLKRLFGLGEIGQQNLDIPPL